MWSVKCIVVPLIIGDTGRVTKDLKENLTAISGKHRIGLDSLQKTAILGNITHNTESTAV